MESAPEYRFYHDLADWWLLISPAEIIAAWFYNNTNRSVLIVGLFHSAFNVTTQNEFSDAFLPVSDDIQFLILVAVPILPAVLIAVLTKGRLSYRSRNGSFHNPAYDTG